LQQIHRHDRILKPTKGENRMKKMRFAAVIGTAVILLAAGCGSSKKASSNTSTGVTAGGGTTVKATQGSAITICVITHGDNGVFWSVFQKGAEKAGKDLGITVRYIGSNNTGTKQAADINQCVTDKVQGLAVSLADPAAVKDAVLAAGKAGIPVVTTNSGSNLYKQFGAFTHIGQDEFIAGAGAGDKFQAAGMKHVLCAKQEQTNTGLDARCAGMKSTFKGAYDEMTTSGDASGTQQGEVKAKLDSLKDVDAIFGTGPVIGHDAAAAAKELGRKVMIGAVDLSTDILKDISAGDVSFTIDQQQYLQGYVSVLALYLNATNKNTLGGGLPINTGPGFVDKSNADAVAKLVAAGTR
jgi:simple sugar transport system substrate-binding protein